jgi:hypothetical protein
MPTLKNPLRKVRNNQGMRHRGTLFIHHPTIPGKFVQLPRPGQRKPVRFIEELRILEA